jgi:hypothetical protein
MSDYKYINPFEEQNIEVLQKKLYECQRALTWSQFGEQIYVKWTHRLLQNGYEGAEKIRKRLAQSSK